MTTLSVNWELAPAGTTHFLPENADYYNTWIKKSGREWFVWYDGDWNESYDIRWYDDEFISKSGEDQEEEKQIQWDGEGLPPVGTVCEVGISHINGGVWTEVEILAHAKHDSDDAVLVRENNGRMHGVIYGMSWFRPIPTPEQIAEEERKAAIAEINEVLGFGPAHDAGERIYQAGYRKEHK